MIHIWPSTGETVRACICYFFDGLASLNGGKRTAFKLEIFKLYIRLHVTLTGLSVRVLLSLGVNIREEFHLMISPSRRKTDLLVDLLLVDRELSIPREGIFFFFKNLHSCRRQF